MNLTPTEIDRLIIFNAAEFARRNQRLGIRLSRPEAIALIADEMLLAARRNMPYVDIVDMAGRLLTTDDVEPGVGAMIDLISVEGNFEEGTKLIVVFAPIGPGASEVPPPVPGEIITPDEDIELNGGRQRCSIKVLNMGDRDIQVRSHAHFFEANAALHFDRARRPRRPRRIADRLRPGGPCRRPARRARRPRPSSRGGARERISRMLTRRDCRNETPENSTW
jgi:urease subunit gamma/beta